MLRNKTKRTITMAIVATFILISSAPTSSSTTPGSADCTDEAGVYTPPDGMILGGPEDNSLLQPFASWLLDCDFIWEEVELLVETPFEEVLDSWEACQASARDTIMTIFIEAATTGRTVPIPGPGDPGMEDMDCGDAPTLESADADGIVRNLVPFTHIGSSEGSITFSSYTYKDTSGSSSQKAGRSSTVFYNNGDANNVRNVLEDDSHWKEAHGHHWGTCGGTRYAHIHDAMHGTSDKWWSSSPQTEAHHSSNCMTERQHLRHYGKGLHDTHSSNFGDYSTANVHWDDWWHNNPSGSAGVNHLHGDRADFSTSWFKSWSTNQGDYIYYYRIG